MPALFITNSRIRNSKWSTHRARARAIRLHMRRLNLSVSSISLSTCSFVRCSLSLLVDVAHSWKRVQGNPYDYSLRPLFRRSCNVQRIYGFILLFSFSFLLTLSLSSLAAISIGHRYDTVGYIHRYHDVYVRTVSMKPRCISCIRK